MECSACGHPYRTAAKSKRYRMSPMPLAVKERWERRYGPLHHGPIVPQTILDPFAGAGTTGLVADRLGRSFIGCELNPAYVTLARRRIAADCPLFNETEATP
jgi:adenine-specific DNA methylase